MNNNFFRRFKNIGFFKKPGLTVGLVVILSMWVGASAMSSLESYGSEAAENWNAGLYDDAKEREKALKEAARQREKALKEAAHQRDKALKEAARARQQGDRLEINVPNATGLLRHPQEVYVDKFDKIVVYDCINVVYHQGEYTGKVEIMADTDDEIAVMVSVRDGELKLADRGTNKDTRQKITVNITSPLLSELRLYRASSFTTNGSLKITDTLLVETNEASKANFGEITGTAIDFKSNGASEIYVLAADVENVKLYAEAASTMRVKVVNAANIIADASSAATITLGGRCDQLSVGEHSSGTVNTKGLIVQTASSPSRNVSEDKMVAPTIL